MITQALGRAPAGNPANVTINILAPGQMYGDRINQLDFRIAKIIKIARTRTMVGIDLYNALSKPTGDLDKAKAALTACGHPSGFTTGLAYRSDRPKEVAAATALQAALARVGITLQLHGYPTAGYYTSFAGAPNYVHQHNLGLVLGGWSPDWPDGYGMMDELVDGGTIVATGNTNIGELNDPNINNLFKSANNPSLTLDQRSAIFGQIDKAAMGQAVIMPNVYAKNLLYRPPSLTNAYVWTPYGEYNYAVLGVSG